MKKEIDVDKLKSQISKVEKRVSSCVPKSLRRAFNEELERYVGLKIQESKILNPVKISGFCPD